MGETNPKKKYVQVIPKISFLHRKNPVRLFFISMQSYLFFIRSY